MEGTVSNRGKILNRKIHFTPTPTDKELLFRAARRGHLAAQLLLEDYSAMDCYMDLTACHLNGAPLRLLDLLDADPVDFIKDIRGIRDNIDRKTGQLTNFYVPQFAKRRSRILRVLVA